jgi:hypothetical protein
VARYLVEQTQAKVALTQSDKISLVLEPFDHVGIGEVYRALANSVSRLEAGNVAVGYRRIQDPFGPDGSRRIARARRREFSVRGTPPEVVLGCTRSWWGWRRLAS